MPNTSQLTMATTYEKLIPHHLNKLRKALNAASSQQIERNHMTALRGFLKTVRKSEFSPVGTELTEDFDAELKRHLQSADLSARSQIDRKSLLTSWQNTYSSMGEAVPIRTGRERSSASALPHEKNPFEKVLWSALSDAKLAPKTAAKLSGISTSAIGRWSRGALPNARTLSSFGKLEETLSLKPGTLLEAYDLCLKQIPSIPTNAYRQRLKKQSELVYVQKEADLSPELMGEWRNFLQYKTTKFETALKRPKKSRWSLVPATNSTLTPSVFCSLGGLVCPTADFTWQQIGRFVGFLRLPTGSGGYGLASDTAQTLAWAAVPEAVDAYLTFQTGRSDGLVHGGQSNFAAFIMSLVHPVHGYLTQSSSFQAKLPVYATAGKSWEQMCRETMQLSAAWKSEARDKSRDPSAPIQFLLDLPEPAAPVFSAMQRIRRNGDQSMPQSIQQSIARRDELLLGLLLSNPLRSKNLITLTYKEDNTGNVYQTVAGNWRIRIGGGMFKNRSRVGGELYDVPVAGWLVKLLSDYVSLFRPTLRGRGKDDYLFLTRDGKRFDGLSQQVASLTRSYIPGCGGIRSHAFRHLVATDWLTKNPNDFLTVAELLNDTIAVVMKNYAHLKKDVAFGRYEAYVQKMLPTGLDL